MKDQRSQNKRHEERPSRRFQFSLRTFLVWWTVVCVAVALSVPIVRHLRHGANRASCLGLRIGMIAFACQNYESVHGRFPPAFIADEHDVPMHSWRVLILPYLGHEGLSLYKRYNFSEPWNGPNNRLLAKDMPDVYRCPARGGSRGVTTSYVAVVGPRTAWPGTRGRASYEITDAMSSTLLIVEVADSNIHWMEPRDMSPDQAMAGVNVDRDQGISSYHPGGACVACTDGTFMFLGEGVSPELLEALLTIDGGEQIYYNDSDTLVLEPAR